MTNSEAMYKDSAFMHKSQMNIGHMAVTVGVAEATAATERWLEEEYTGKPFNMEDYSEVFTTD